MLDPDPVGSKALGSGLVPDPAGSNISGSGVDPDPAGSKILDPVHPYKYGYIRHKRSRVESHLYPVKEGQRYINLNPGRLFVQQPPQRERDREAHLN